MGRILTSQRDETSQDFLPCLLRSAGLPEKAANRLQLTALFADYERSGVLLGTILQTPQIKWALFCPIFQLIFRMHAFL